VVAHFNSSWCVRVRRDDLLTIQVEGTKGSAVAGLRHCWIQPYDETPRPVWNPDIESPLNYFAGWRKVPEQATFENAFKRQWELFLRHVVKAIRSAGDCSKAPRAFSWRRKVWNPGAGGPGWTSRTLRPVDQAGHVAGAEAVIDVDHRDVAGATVQHAEQRRQALKLAP